MTLLNTRFGDVDYSSDDIIEFLDGLVGFAGCRRFLLLNQKPNSSYRWLQSLDDPEVAFLLAFPEALVPGYRPDLGAGTKEVLEISEDTPVLMLTTVSIPAGRRHEATTNCSSI